ncbi:odorant receptor 131-2-like [Leptodactylus fuscus]|uniref:odorant receptor 131-2-like n=1 Tax=Leptodactylus fuscus TaxID=238119 RepID=UPI003F4ED45A
MVTSTMLQDNSTDTPTINSQISQFIQWFCILSIIISFSFFLCFITLVSNIFFKTPILRNSARYVLFVFLLLNDTLYLLLGFYLMLASIYSLHTPVPLCYILYTLSSAAFRVTPCNLAAMALERYVAICHPLQHMELCTPQRANVVFIGMCSLMLIPFLIEFFVMASSMTNIFKLYLICRHENLIFNPIQNVIRSVALIFCFTSVGIVIVFTYVRIMQVAKKVTPQSSSAFKAGRTVMIHAFQVLLCTSALLTILTQSFSTKWPGILATVHFFVFTCLPRFLSPLIYGLRDELLRQLIKKSFSRYFG